MEDAFVTASSLRSYSFSYVSLSKTSLSSVNLLLSNSCLLIIFDSEFRSIVFSKFHPFDAAASFIVKILKLSSTSNISVASSLNALRKFESIIQT